MRQLKITNKNNNSDQKELRNILLDNIIEVQNIRTEYEQDTIIELSRSIEKNGLIQPITVIEIENNKYEIVAGHRRFRAFKYLLNENKPTYSSIPVIIKSDIKDIDEIQLLENIQREDLRDVEIEKAIKTIMKREGLKQKDLAERINKSLDWIKKRTASEHIREKIKESAPAHLQEKIDNLPVSTINELSKVKSNDVLRIIENDSNLSKQKVRDKINNVKKESVKHSNTDNDKVEELEEKGEGIKSSDAILEKFSHKEIINAIPGMLSNLTDELSLRRFINWIVDQFLQHSEKHNRDELIRDLESILLLYKESLK